MTQLLCISHLACALANLHRSQSLSMRVQFGFNNTVRGMVIRDAFADVRFSGIRVAASWRLQLYGDTLLALLPIERIASSQAWPIINGEISWWIEGHRLDSGRSSRGFENWGHCRKTRMRLRNLLQVQMWSDHKQGNKVGKIWSKLEFKIKASGKTRCLKKKHSNIQWLNSSARRWAKSLRPTNR